MKKQAVLVIAIAALLASCMGDGKRGHRSDFLPPIKIEIPAVIQSDAKLTNLVKESENAINQFSDNMEYLIEDIKPYKNKNKEDLGTFDKIKVAKIGVEFLSNSTKGLAVLDKLNKYTEKQVVEQHPLTDEQMEAMAAIYDAFEARMNQLDEKYKEFGGEATN